MIFAEVFTFLLAIIFLMFLLKPLRKRLENYFYKMFTYKLNPKKKNLADVPLNRRDYTKKENKPHE